MTHVKGPMRAVRRPESFYPSSFTRFSFFSLRGKNANHWVATSSQIVNCLNESGFPSRESFSCLLHFLRCIRRLNFKQVKKISVHFCWFFFFQKKEAINSPYILDPSLLNAPLLFSCRFEFTWQGRGLVASALAQNSIVENQRGRFLSFLFAFPLSPRLRPAADPACICFFLKKNWEPIPVQQRPIKKYSS